MKHLRCFQKRKFSHLCRVNTSTSFLMSFSTFTTLHLALPCKTNPRSSISSMHPNTALGDSQQKIFIYRKLLSVLSECQCGVATVNCLLNESSPRSSRHAHRRSSREPKRNNSQSNKNQTRLSVNKLRSNTTNPHFVLYA